MDRARARGRCPTCRRGRQDRRRAADAGGRLPHANHGRHARRRDLGLAQSVRGQRHQGLLGCRPQVQRGPRAAGRNDRRRSRPGSSMRDEAPAVAAVDESDAYLDHLHDMLADPDGLRGRRLVVDCANGATTPVASRLFRSLGFDVVLLGASPDGRNINLGCGSTHPESMAATRARSWGDCRRRLRRRRRSRDLRRRARPHRRWRCRDVDVRAAAQEPKGGCAAIPSSPR